MYIMTAYGWRPLAPSCQNEVWSISTWDANVRRHVPDQKGESLKHIATAAAATCEEVLIRHPRIAYFFPSPAQHYNRNRFRSSGSECATRPGASGCY
jgi:hypothetical protein